MTKLKIVLILLIFSTSKFGFSQNIDVDKIGPDLLDRMIGKDSLVDHVLSNREKYRFQFMVTEIFEYQSELHLGETSNYSRPDWYFYPASMVKLPVALMSLEKLNELNYSRKASLTFNKDYICGNMKFVDDSRKNKLSFEKMIRELIIISNNTYYNSLYHFLTPAHINEEMNRRGLIESNIYRDFSGCEMPLNLKTHGFSVQEKDTVKKYTQKSSYLELAEFSYNYMYDSTKLFGSKNEYRGEIVDGPFDFNYNLEYTIQDIHSTSMRLFFPEFFAERDCWNLRKNDREFLLESMKSVPKDLKEKKYFNQKRYPDNLYKYIVHGDGNPKYEEVISYSKMGISYGFVTETAYVHNPKTNRHFVVTANIYVNSNDTVNDGNYEYEEFARPFFARFGQLLLEL